MIKTKLEIDSNDNFLFVTSQCNNRCLMCSQPPLNRDDIDSLFGNNMLILDSAPVGLKDIGITGGEPTLLKGKLFDLIEKIKSKLPDTEIHILSNGRAFKEREYVKELAKIGTDKLLIGIPLHSDYSHDHDCITQIEGSYVETMKGLYNLAEFGIKIESNRKKITSIKWMYKYKLNNSMYKLKDIIEKIKTKINSNITQNDVYLFN